MAQRVLQLTPSYHPVIGGIEEHVSNLVSKLPEYGYEPFVLTPDRKNIGSEDRIFRVPCLFHIQKATFSPRILQYLYSLDYELLHVHAPFHFGLEFASFAKLTRRKPMVITVHMYPGRNNLISRIYNDVLYNSSLDIADVVIPTTWDYVSEFSWFQNNSNKCRVVPLGVDVNHYTPVDDAREMLGYDLKEKILLFVGSMEPLHDYKNIDKIIEAFACSDLADRLVLVGEGEKKENYREVARREGVFESVEFPGYVCEDELPTYYSAADAVVLASEEVESFGIILLEAMACGTPVVTTAIPGVREVVDDMGVLVTPGNKLELAYGIDKVLTLNINPRKYIVNNFSQSMVVEQVSNIYDKMRV